MEVIHDHSKDSGVLEEDRIRSHDILRRLNTEKREEEREELDIRDKESEV